MFHLRNSSMSMLKTLPYRTIVLPIHSQYEFRTTLNIISSRLTGKRFQQDFIDNRIITWFDNQMMLSIFVNHQEQGIIIIVDVYHLWISMHELEKILYSGCVRQIEVGYNPAYSILLTDRSIELNENWTVDCKRSLLVNNMNNVRLILSLKTNDPKKTVLYDD